MVLQQKLSEGLVESPLLRNKAKKTIHEKQTRKLARGHPLPPLSLPGSGNPEFTDLRRRGIPRKTTRTIKTKRSRKAHSPERLGNQGRRCPDRWDSRETKPAESKPPVEKPAQSTNPSDAGSATDTTDNPTTATSPGTKPDTEETKPVNGMVPDGGKEKGKEPEVKENNKKEDEKEQQPQHKKAHALLSRAVMRRITTMEKAPSGQTSPSPTRQQRRRRPQLQRGGQVPGRRRRKEPLPPSPHMGAPLTKRWACSHWLSPPRGLAPLLWKRTTRRSLWGLGETPWDSLWTPIPASLWTTDCRRRTPWWRLRQQRRSLTPCGMTTPWSARPFPPSQSLWPSSASSSTSSCPVLVQLFVSDQNIYGERR